MDAAAKVTTADLQRMLLDRFEAGKYARFFDVPNEVGQGQTRRADAIIIGMWGSTGRRIDGFELKASRADWLRELKHVQKADPFLEVCDRWWLVTADRSIAKLEELPTCWGWMAATPKGLRVEKPAPDLGHDGAKIDRAFALGLFRKMDEDAMKSPEVQAALQSARTYREEEIEQRVQSRMRMRAESESELRKRVERFEQESGINLDTWRLGNVGKIVRALSEIDYGEGFKAAARTLEHQERSLVRLLSEIQAARAALAEPCS